MCGIGIRRGRRMVRIRTINQWKDREEELGLEQIVHYGCCMIFIGDQVQRGTIS